MSVDLENSSARQVEVGSAEESSRITDAKSVAQLLTRASNVVVLTGAGISADSGIPTFRGKDGFWTEGSENYAPESLATWSMYDKMPTELWRWYQYRWGACRKAVPNAGHRALVQLQGLVHGGITIVTQNVDGLHLDAGSDPARLHEIHGRLSHMRCDDRVKGSCCYGLDLQDPANITKIRETIVDAPAPAKDEENEPLPLCKKCGVRMRPKLLWFDENYNEACFGSMSAVAAVKNCDVLIVVGTQLTTHMPQWIAHQAHQRGAALIRIDPIKEWDVPDHVPFQHFQTNSSEALSSIVDCLRRLKSALPSSIAASEACIPETKAVPTQLPKASSVSACTSAASKFRHYPDASPPYTEFEYERAGDKIRFQVSAGVTGSRTACDLVSRACYRKFEQGCTEAEVVLFRDECVAKLKTAASMRASPILQRISSSSVQLSNNATSTITGATSTSTALPRQVTPPMRPHRSTPLTDGPSWLSSVATPLRISAQPTTASPLSTPGTSSRPCTPSKLGRRLKLTKTPSSPTSFRHTPSAPYPQAPKVSQAGVQSVQNGRVSSSTPNLFQLMATLRGAKAADFVNDLNSFLKVLDVKEVTGRQESDTCTRLGKRSASPSSSMMGPRKRMTT